MVKGLPMLAVIKIAFDEAKPRTIGCGAQFIQQSLYTYVNCAGAAAYLIR
jgi:hypothetical protein